MRKAGYIWLKQQFDIEAIDYWTTSYVKPRGHPQTIERDGYIRQMHRPSAWPGEHWSHHLEFALKREGLHLEVLRKLLPQLPVDELVSYITATPTGRNTRIVWFLYEALGNGVLEIPDLDQGNYVPLLDPALYLTATPEKIRRQRIDFNLLGSLSFSPIVRRDGADFHRLNATLRQRCEAVVETFPQQLYQRAVRYLYTKESKSSYAIERETPSAQRARQFVSLLERAWRDDFLSKQALVNLQNAIVEPRYSNKGYRDSIGEQIYIGETIAPGSERVHYVAPKPEDIGSLMSAFIDCARKILADPQVPDVTASALVAYLFNFIHPFSDGNGRIHRFLMHHILARRGFGPAGIVLPVSAVILKRLQDYDRSLESYSRPLMDKLEYTLDDRLRMQVHGDTKDHYRYIDCTVLNTVFHQFLEQAIESELPAEISYLQRHDQCRAQMRQIIDLPDRVAELFIVICRQNAGVLSKNKRNLSEFEPLSDREIHALETIVQDIFPELDGH